MRATCLQPSTQRQRGDLAASQLVLGDDTHRSRMTVTVRIRRVL
ncbi:MAG: hypothetical protein AAGG01_14045 [Planctomycetota bacterium]